MKAFYFLLYAVLGSAGSVAAQTCHLPTVALSSLETLVHRYSPGLRLPGPAAAAQRGQQTSVTQPGRVMRYEWNPATNRWEAPQLVLYTYTAQARLSQETHADSATASPTYRLNYTYTAGNQLTQTLQQDYTGGSWENSFRRTATFDARGTPTEELNQDWISGAWSTTAGTRSANNYTTTGFLAQQVVQTFSTATTSFVNDVRITYKIPASGPYTEFTVQRWSGGQWQDEFRVTGITWYDAGRQLATGLQIQIPINIFWVSVLRLTATYQTNGSSVSTYEARPNPAGPWLNDSRTTETYDAYNNRLSLLQEVWSGTAWAINDWSRALLTYNAQQIVLRRDEQLAIGTAPFINQQRYNFGSFQVIPLRTPPAAPTAQLQLFPNPTTGLVTLRLAGLTGSLTGEVLNALGQQVLRFSLPSPANELDVSALQAGLYTVRLQTPQGMIIKRLVRQ
ncbi:hypothetical protein GCM10022408_15040 [Hymenobacter fastidiosus]|uniref:Secretion system C-terminal sorting domain-containing protein n=1 Tax=Hymenobacter fastidiosus TaxID=486264 RepID=A0ABP7RZ08_9BACT